MKCKICGWTMKRDKDIFGQREFSCRNSGCGDKPTPNKQSFIDKIKQMVKR